MANEDMAQAWDGAEGEHWTRWARHYEEGSAPYRSRMLQAAALQPGERVLDVGCGAGLSTVEAAQVTGSALGIDLSGPMLALATERGGRVGATFEQADVQTHALPPGAFDVAMSCFGAMFFDDPVAAFTNVTAALRPAGRVALMAWQPLEKNAWLTVLREALAVGRQLPSPPVSVPGPFGLADPEHVRSTLSAAGLVEIEIAPVEERGSFGRDADDAYAFVSELGVTRGLTQELSDEARAQAMANLRRVVEEHMTPDGVRVGGAAWLITGRRPDDL